jgi:chromate transporter
MTQATYTLKALTLYFLKLGAIGFGGPVALVGYMHRDLVEKRKWISETDYKEGMALAQLAPGPLAAQLAIYLGYVHYHILGATLVGLAFVIPSFIMVVALGWAYMHFGGLPWMQAVFYGVASAVIGIIGISSYKLTAKSIGKDRLLWAICLVMAVTTFLMEEENIWLIVLGGVIVWWTRTASNKKTPTIASVFPVILQAAHTATASSRFAKMAWFFTKAGTFVFGSGLAIIPFLYGGVVKEYQWLNEQQFVDAVAVAMITPGPVVITVGFIGYLIAGFSGACIAALATFLPCYLFTILPAPYFKKYGKHPAIKAMVDGITAGAVGAIIGAVAVLAKRQFTDVITVVIAVTSALVLFKFKKIQEPYIIVAAAIAGLIIKFLLNQ